MARLRKISGRYYAYFRSREREPTEKSWPLRVSEQRAARRKLRCLEKAYDEGDFDPWAGGWQREYVTVKTAVERFLEQKKSGVTERTYSTYEGILTRFRDMLPPSINLRDLKPEKVRRFVYRYSTRKDKLSNATQRKRYRHVRAWLNWCEKQGLLDDNPLDDVSKPSTEEKEPAYGGATWISRTAVSVFGIETTSRQNRTIRSPCAGDAGCRNGRGFWDDERVINDLA